MVIFSIAQKTIKVFMRNIILLPILIGIPVFQIYLLSVVMANNQEVEAVSGFVEVVLLQSANLIEPSQFFAATIMVTFLLITGMIAATSIISEREDHTLTRTFSAPLLKWQIILGNLIGQVIITLVITAAVIVISQLILGIDWGGQWLSLLVITIFVVYVALSLGFVFAGIFKNAATAGGAMSFLVIGMSFLSDSLTGGSITGSGQFGAIGNFTINKWAYEAYLAIMQGQNLSSVYYNLIILTVLGTVFALIATLLFRKENIYE